jgi:hypothetical protein
LRLVKLAGTSMRPEMPRINWHGKLPDWQMGVTWLAFMVIAIVIYFVPMARLVEAMTN